MFPFRGFDCRRIFEEEGPVTTVVARNGDFANFELQVFGTWPAPDTGITVGSWSFPLRVVGTSFVDLPDPITVTLNPGT